MKKIILIIIAAITLIAATVGGTLLLVGSNDGSPTSKTAAEGAIDKIDETEDEQEEALYLALSPAFVANANTPGRRQLLQLRLEVMSYDKKVLEQLKQDMALVRDAIIMLLSAQDFDKLGFPEEKQRLRDEIKRAIEATVAFPKNTQIETVLFTEFLME